WLLAPRPARAQHVQAHAPDNGCQPGAEVLDGTSVGAAEPQPGFLDGVVGLAERAEHPVGHRPQLRFVVLESLCQPVLLVHRSHSFVAFRRMGDERNRADVTKGEQKREPSSYKRASDRPPARPPADRAPAHPTRVAPAGWPRGANNNGSHERSADRASSRPTAWPTGPSHGRRYGSS